MQDLTIGDELWEYMRRVTLREPDLLRRLREETALLPNSNFQITAEQGQFMALLMHLIGARRTIEIGVYTGYSALAVAQALPDDGRIIACDINEDWTAVARRYWREAGVDRKIDLRIGRALNTLDDLIASGEGNRFDFVFIDAGQDQLCELLRASPGVAAPGWIDRRGQCTLVWSRDRCIFR